MLIVMRAEKLALGVIAENLRRLRRRASLSQEALVAKTDGVSIATLKNLERGSNQNPEVSTLGKLAGALGVSVSDLFKEPRKRA